MHSSRRDTYLILLALIPLVGFIYILMNWRQSGEPNVTVPGLNVKLPRIGIVDKFTSRLPSPETLNPLSSTATTQDKVIAVVLIVLVTVLAIVIGLLLLDLLGRAWKYLTADPAQEQTPVAGLTESELRNRPTR